MPTSTDDIADLTGQLVTAKAAHQDLIGQADRAADPAPVAEELHQSAYRIADLENRLEAAKRVGPPRVLHPSEIVPDAG